MTGPSKQALAGHHLTEAIKHLTSAAEFVRDLPDRDDEVLDHLALVVEGAIETIRDVRGEVEKDTGAPVVRSRAPKKPDRRAGERRAAKRRLDDKRKSALRSRGSAR